MHMKVFVIGEHTHADLEQRLSEVRINDEWSTNPRKLENPDYYTVDYFAPVRLMDLFPLRSGARALGSYPDEYRKSLLLNAYRRFLHDIANDTTKNEQEVLAEVLSMTQVLDATRPMAKFRRGDLNWRLCKIRFQKLARVLYWDIAHSVDVVTGSGAKQKALEFWEGYYPGVSELSREEFGIKYGRVALGAIWVLDQDLWINSDDSLDMRNVQHYIIQGLAPEEIISIYHCHV